MRATSLFASGYQVLPSLNKGFTYLLQSVVFISRGNTALCRKDVYIIAILNSILAVPLQNRILSQNEQSEIFPTSLIPCEIISKNSREQGKYQEFLRILEKACDVIKFLEILVNSRTFSRARLPEFHTFMEIPKNSRE